MDYFSPCFWYAQRCTLKSATMHYRFYSPVMNSYAQSSVLILYILSTRRMSICLSVSFLSFSHFFFKLTFLSKSLIKSNTLGDTGELMLIYTIFEYFPVLKILMITAFFSFKRKLRGREERIKD